VDTGRWGTIIIYIALFGSQLPFRVGSIAVTLEATYLEEKLCGVLEAYLMY
jgi:hypothetical protein